MQNTRKFPLILSSFWLKIIALLTMTIDHVGFFLEDNYTYDWLPDLSNVFRIIGRFALPLFCFMIAEGAIHTKNFRKYALKLGIMASLISVVLIVTGYYPEMAALRRQGVIFLDLLLGAVSVFCLRQKKWYIKLIALLPLAYGITSFIVSSLESCGCHGKIIWFPFFIRTQYGWYGILMIILFYAAIILAKLFISYLSSITGIKEENYKDSDIERHTINIISAVMIAAATLLFYACEIMMPAKYVFLDYRTQLFAIIAGAFILLYNGRRGYNKTWFQYGCYLYYPLHIGIIYLIFLLTGNI